MSMNRLVIFDCSPYLWAGTKSETGSKQVHFGFKKGGIQMLMEAILYETEHRGSKVIVTFDSPTDRKEYMPSYKSHRVSDPEIFVQEQILYQELLSARVQAIKVDGFESDDLIAEVVKQNYNDFNKIIIKTNDMDLAHCIDTAGKVSIETPTSISYNVERLTYETVLSNTSTAKDVVKKYRKEIERVESTPDVNINNFSSTVVKGHVVFYNSITPFKVFFGDKSDGIPPFNYSSNSMDLYLAFCEWALEKYNNLELLSSVRTMVTFYKENPFNLTETELDDLYNRIYVFYPRAVKMNLKYDLIKQITKEGFMKIANNFGIKKVADYFGEQIYTNTNQQNLLREISHKIKSGKISVEEGLPLTSNETFLDEKTQNIDVYLGANVGEF